MYVAFNNECVIKIFIIGRETMYSCFHNLKPGNMFNVFVFLNLYFYSVYFSRRQSCFYAPFNQYVSFYAEQCVYLILFMYINHQRDFMMGKTYFRIASYFWFS